PRRRRATSCPSGLFGSLLTQATCSPSLASATATFDSEPPVRTSHSPASSSRVNPLGVKRTIVSPRVQTSWVKDTAIETRSVLGNRRIDLVGPGRNPTRQVVEPLETRLLEQIDGARAAAAHLTVGDDLVGHVQLVEPVSQ